MSVALRIGSPRGVWFLVAALAVSVGCGAPPTPRRFEFEEAHMGTPFRIVLYATGDVQAGEAARAAFARIEALNGIMSDYDGGSELSRLCAAPSGVPVVVSEDLFAVLRRAQDFARATDGAFDVTVGPLVRLWRRARRQGRLPAPERLIKARESVGYRHLRLDAATRSATLMVAGMQLDLGGIAKGYAVQAALDVLRSRGLDAALVDGGGDLALGAPPPGEEAWTIGLTPVTEATVVDAGLRLAHVAVATSGDAFRFVEIDGVRYSHLIDPRTGLGLTDRSAVTVVAPDATTADALASAVSVLGPAAALELIARYDGASFLVRRATDPPIESPGFPPRVPR